MSAFSMAPPQARRLQANWGKNGYGPRRLEQLRELAGNL
jgi:hypothetical protein